MQLLEKLEKAFKNHDAKELRRLSNTTIEQSVLTEDKIGIEVSIVAYAFSKMFSKPHYHDKSDWKAFLKDVEEDLHDLVEEKDNPDTVLKILQQDIQVDISELDEVACNFVRNSLHKSRVKQASRIYALGISLNRAIELTGADRIELQRYIGTTKIHDREFTSVKSISDRFKTTKKIFSG